ncbi:hypothetical protein EHS25_004110 [Saitozyma podzolica]|uniref:Uncharacterized protein n=1 Tax=Saitozyma podzolica TaxID=1890683 RepID=A0A427YTA2_9TREE|nr:hypothetical protein EHS25_004110 [Saitozyma podzolica]
MSQTGESSETAANSAPQWTSVETASLVDELTAQFGISRTNNVSDYQAVLAEAEDTVSTHKSSAGVTRFQMRSLIQMMVNAKLNEISSARNTSPSVDDSYANAEANAIASADADAADAGSISCRSAERGFPPLETSYK